MNDTDINKIVSKVLREKFKSAIFKNAKVESQEDFDGGSIIRITAFFKKDDVASDKMIEAMHGIRAELLKKGEERFVLLDGKYPHEENIDEEVE